MPLEVGSVSALIPVITSKGLQAVFAADSRGLDVTISHIALGDSGYIPAKNGDGYATQSRLRSERQRIAIGDGKRVGAHQVDLSAVADGDAEYWVRELGFYLSDGTLFAVWSDSQRAIAWKSKAAPLVVALELALSALPANSVNVVAGGGNLELLLTNEMAAVATALANVQLEQLRQADKLKNLTGTH